MRTIVHLSDIHFGRVNPLMVKPLIRAVNEIAPDVVVVSGDLTQRATSRQFMEARDFLAQLPTPQVVVPGNHDVPLYKVVDRFLTPLHKYRRYVSEDLEPFYLDEEIAILGINTARSLTFKEGRISHEQIARIRDRFSSLHQVIKVLVTHHPLDLPPDFPGQVVGRAGRAMEVLSLCRADLLLAGHYHLSHTGDTEAHYPIPGYAALVVLAGTATSVRGRGELNSFNVIRIQAAVVTIDRQKWQGDMGRFQLSGQERFMRTEGGWVPWGKE